MEQKFFTARMILKAQQIWFDETRPKSGTSVIHCQMCPDPQPGCEEHCRAGAGHVFNAVACFEHDYQAAKRGVRGQVLGWSQLRSRQDVEPGITMKNGYLKAPWSEDDERLAFWLFTSGAHVYHDRDDDGRVCSLWFQISIS